MLFFKLLERQVGGGLVVTHVIVPCLRELKELRFLRSLDVLELLLLCRPYVVLLPDRFFSEELIKLTAGLLCFLVVSLNLALLAVFFKQSEEVKDLVVGRNIDDTVRGTLLNVLLSVKIIWIILCEFVFNLLHKLDKFIECHVFNKLIVRCSISAVLVVLLSNLNEEIFGFLSISLK